MKFVCQYMCSLWRVLKVDFASFLSQYKPQYRNRKHSKHILKVFLHINRKIAAFIYHQEEYSTYL